MRQPPSYIQASGVLDSPPKFQWKGKGMHLGPEQGTKLHGQLERLTTCGIATLSACVEEWLIWRLNTQIDLQRFLHHTDAVLAWEIDRRYRDESSFSGTTAIPKDTPINQALGDCVWMVRRVTDDEFWDYPAASDDKASGAIYVTRQTMSDKSRKAFSEWLDWAVERAAKLDPRPRKARPKRGAFKTDEEYRDALRPYFGRPLPRESLDPKADYKSDDRAEFLKRFLESLEWKSNPFLRSPAEMKKLGFNGTPYTL